MSSPQLSTQEIQAKYQTVLDTSVLWQKFKKFHVCCLVTASLLITTAICIAAAMRYFFKLDFFGLEEFVLITACVLYFIGAAQGSFEKSHISADFMEKLMAKRGGLGHLLFIQKTIELVMSYVFIYWGFLMIQWCIKAWPVTPVWRIPFLIPESIVCLSFILMAVYNTAHYVLLLKILFQHNIQEKK
ncbi:TRAP transporter small permease [Desulfospira joergensenii]|uniref:TRAP transporter small permease n=1 Tax=Desulfospira joergensenii TaxID=53329 RepID=UPI0003B3EBA7|nr:TRAP transporter small permease [Desulfospira joergensenii]